MGTGCARRGGGHVHVHGHGHGHEARHGHGVRSKGRGARPAAPLALTCLFWDAPLALTCLPCLMRWLVRLSRHEEVDEEALQMLEKEIAVLLLQLGLATDSGQEQFSWRRTQEVPGGILNPCRESLPMIRDCVSESLDDAAVAVGAW